MTTPSYSSPVVRRLRILAFDPSLATRLETAGFNQLTVEVPWEDLGEGPVGEYLEVVDHDPASGVFYHPVDLDDPDLLAQDGLPPSESNPQFHQQMVYAVAMSTIRRFERALGRVAYWADRTTQVKGKYSDQFVRRLRIYPHALRDRNAYYSPRKKALLFGYFPVRAKDAFNAPGTVVFTCLSHDIIAHEVTHALLDGVHPRFNEPTNPDVHGFHEAFADLVALFQHFSYPQVLESQIRKTRGELHTENLLSQLAQQFGRAIHRGSALRDALGEENPETKVWEPRLPDAHALDEAQGPHARGAILVAAVFRAFLLIYRSRTADLLRIASGGTGVLPAGDLHPDLVRRLAAEAAKCADRVLQMCIRAIDYCPPVGITFGEFLRGVVTADLEFSPQDRDGFRLVFIESFREWGIYPRGLSTLGLDALAWPTGRELTRELVASNTVPGGEAAEGRRDRHLLDLIEKMSEPWNLESDRFESWDQLAQDRQQAWIWLREGGKESRAFGEILGLVIDGEGAPATVHRGKDGKPTLEVHSLRPALRRTVDGSTRTDLVLEITQRRRGYFEAKEQEEEDRRKGKAGQRKHCDFWYRAGCTVLIDPVTVEIRRVIRTPGTIADDRELERVRRFLTGELGATGNAFDAGLARSLRLGAREARDEPFALLHNVEED